MEELSILWKRTLLVTFCLCIVLTPFFTGSSNVKASSQVNPRYGGTLRIGYGTDPVSFNPIVNYWSTSMYFDINVFNKPYTFDDLYNIVGDAMIKYPTISQEDEQTIYTMELEHNIKWQDGIPLTAEDVKFTFETLAWGGQNKSGVSAAINDRLELPANRPNAFDNLTKIQTEGNYIIKFFFDGVQLNTWLTEMTSNVILPKHLWEGFNKYNPVGYTFENNPYNTLPVGSGPFKVTEYESESYTLMERYIDYFRGIPYLEHLVWIIIPDPVSAMLALENGEIDTVHEQLAFPQSEIHRVNALPQFTVNAFPYTTTWRITFNFHPDAFERWPWLSDNKVRAALEYALDKQAIVDQVLHSVTKPTHTAISWIVGLFAGDYNTEEFHYYGQWKIEPRFYNPEKAQKLLDEAGWFLNEQGIREKNGITLSGLKLPYYSYIFDLAHVIVAYWDDIGIHVVPEAIDGVAFFNEIETPKSDKGLMTTKFNGPFPFALNTMGTGPDPSKIRGWIHSRSGWGKLWDNVPGWATGVSNFGFYSNLRVDELLDLGESTPIYVERKQFYDELQYHVHNDIGFIMLWNKWKIEAWNNDFTGFGTNRPIAWYGRYYRGNDSSTNTEKGVNWRDGTVEPPLIMTTTSTVTEVINLNLFLILVNTLLASIIVYHRRRGFK